MVGAAAAAARAARTNPEPPEASLSVVRQRKETTHPARGLARLPVYRGLASARASFPLPSLLCPATSGRFAHGLRKKKSLNEDKSRW